MYVQVHGTYTLLIMYWSAPGPEPAPGPALGPGHRFSSSSLMLHWTPLVKKGLLPLFLRTLKYPQEPPTSPQEIRRKSQQAHKRPQKSPQAHPNGWQTVMFIDDLINFWPTRGGLPPLGCQTYIKTINKHSNLSSIIWVGMWGFQWKSIRFYMIQLKSKTLP